MSLVKSISYAPESIRPQFPFLSHALKNINDFNGSTGPRSDPPGCRLNAAQRVAHMV